MISYLHTIADEQADTAKRYIITFSTQNQSNNYLDSKIELDGALWEIEQAELEASKTRIFGQTCQKELEAYGNLHTTIGDVFLSNQ